MSEQVSEETLNAVVLPPRKAELVANNERGYIVPRTIEEAHRFAVAIWKAGLAPNSYQSPEQVMIAVMKALEVGLPPLTGLSWIVIVNNRPTIWGDAALALVHQSGQLVSHEVRKIGTVPANPESLATWPEDYGYEFSLERNGHAVPFVGRFTVADARRARLWMNPRKTPWMEYPDRMLLIRARSFPLRDGFADCLAGLSIYEETVDSADSGGRAVVDANDLFGAPSGPVNASGEEVA